MDTDLLNMIKDQKSFETNNANSLKLIIESTDNSVVKMFLSGIMLDSTKHAHILQAIMDVDAGQVLWDIDKQKMVKELEQHIEIEKRMLDNIHDILANNQDTNIETLLTGILTDERRHHRILTQLLTTIENIEVLKEEWADLYIRFQQEDFGRT